MKPLTKRDILGYSSRLLFLTLCLSTLLSCTPDSINVKTSESSVHKIRSRKEIALVSISSLALDKKIDKPLPYEAALAESYMLVQAKNQLQKKGFIIANSSSPFQGNYQFPDSICSSNPRPISHSRFNASYNNSVTPKDSLTFEKAIESLTGEVITYIKTGSVKPFSPSLVFKYNSNYIASQLPTSRLMLLLGNGLIVPSGKSIAQGVATGVATSILTLGMLTVSVYNVSHLQSAVIYIDLLTGNILWSNEMILNGDPSNENTYSVWGNYLFYHFPNQTIVNQTE